MVCDDFGATLTDRQRLRVVVGIHHQAWWSTQGSA